MLRPNNPEIDFDELNARIASLVRESRRTGDASDSQAEQQQMGHAQAIPQVDAAELSLPQELNQLLALDDEAFIDTAMRCYCLDPDNAPLRGEILQSLRAGEEKIDLLLGLRYSQAGHQPKAAGLDLARRRVKSRVYALPLLGPFLKWLRAVVTLPAVSRHYRAALNHHHRRFVEVGEIMEARYAQLSKQLQNQNSRLLNELGRHSNQLQNLRSNVGRQQSYVNELQSEAVRQNQLLIDLAANLQRIETDASEFAAQARSRLSLLDHTIDSMATPTVGTDADGTETLSTGVTAATAISDPDLPPGEEPMNAAFYQALETRFRGSEQDVSDRLSFYLPFLDRLKNLDGPQRIVDIGSGRGEWLALLKENGFPARGVDTNVLNVTACLEQGLEVSADDGIAWLEQQQDRSVAAVTCFHVLEHLPFSGIQAFLVQVLRVLQPGGVLLIETPNPENLLVGSSSFYLDPSHTRPLPPGLIEFMVEYVGFSEVQVHRLHAFPAEIALVEEREVDRRCNQLFYGPQDYAVAAMRPAAN